MNVKEAQDLLFQLFQEHLFSLDGFQLTPSSNEPGIDVVEKDDILDAGVKIINEFGETLGSEKEASNEA